MKKAFCILFLVLAAATAPVFAQVRFNAALAVALLPGEDGIGIVPVSGIHYQIPIKAFRLYAGFRATAIKSGLTTIPNIVAEYSAGPVILEAQLGGGSILSINPARGIRLEFGALFFPDLSVWYPIDKAKALRVGGGVVGALNFSEGNYMVAPYLGVKLVVMTP